MPVIRRMLPFLGVLALAGAASAAEQAGQTTVADVDMSALRYYASRNETARVDAEIRRLRSLYPGWQPPAEPASIALPEAVSDDKPLWDLFAADKLAELEAEIARRKAADPSWTVPEDLAAKLALKQARAALVAASDRSDWPAVIDFAGKTPELVDTADLDVAWRVAEAYARTGDTAKALEIYRSILGAVQDGEARLATVRKAMAVLSPGDVRTLIAMGRTGPDGRPEFDVISLELARRHLGEIVAGTATDDLSPAEQQLLEASAKSGAAGADDAALLGWRASQRKDWAGALGWFQLALSHVPSVDKARPEDAKAAQGAVNALRELGRNAEAESLAYRWREQDPAILLAYAGLVEPDLTAPKPVVMDAERLKRFSEVVLARQLGSGARALGWYAYNIGQFEPAKAWFEKAMAWQPRDSTALGLALSLQRLGDKAGLADFLKRNLPTFPALAALGRTVAAGGDPAGEAGRPRKRSAGGASGGGPAAAARRKDYGRCVALAVQAEASGLGNANTSLQKGWCLMALNRPQEAAIAFAAAQGGSNPGDAAYGQALAELRSNRPDAALAAAASGPLTSQRRNEIGTAVLAQQAANAFDRGQYKAVLRTLDRRRAFVAEPRDLMVLRGWSLYHLLRRDEAAAIFSRLDRQMSTSDTRAGLAAATDPDAGRGH